MDSIINYIKYLRGIRKRSQKIGFKNLVVEYISYYNIYTKLPLKMGFNIDNDYRFFVLYNYIKITYFLWDEESEYIMKFVPRRIQKFLLPKINPLDKKFIVVDKIKFYRLADQHSLPIPVTYFYTQAGKIFSWDGKLITKTKLEQLEGRLIFSKIIDGSAAMGAKKHLFNLSELEISENRLYQDALETHKDILELSPTKALNCVKISTYLKNNGEVKIQLSFIKLGGENSIVDNIGGKSGGGIAIPINTADGTLKDIGYMEVGKILRVNKIPSTGLSFSGFKVPYYKDAENLVIKAHKNVFYELKHIGWDVGITNSGPVLIEANSGADMFAAQMICRPFNYYDDEMIQENLICE